MRVSILQDMIDTSDILESDKAKASWSESAFVLEDDNIFNLAKLYKVVFKLR